MRHQQNHRPLIITLIYLLIIDMHSAWADGPIKDLPKPPLEPLASENLMQMTISLFIVILLIFVLSWFLRKFGQFPNKVNQSVKVISSFSVGSKERVMLLEIDNQRILIGVAHGSVQKLHTYPIKPDKDPYLDAEDDINEH